MNSSIASGQAPERPGVHNRAVLRRVVLAIAALLAALLAFAATQPDRFRIERTLRIDAPPERIYALLENFRSYPAWSPFEMLDPDMERSYSGPRTGRGTVYAWNSDDRGGVGRMQIVDTSPPSKVVIRLDFVTPFEAHNVVEFSLRRAGTATDVTWAMHGTNPFVTKVMQVFVDVDTLIGDDFETGLSNLQRLVEA